MQHLLHHSEQWLLHHSKQCLFENYTLRALMGNLFSITITSKKSTLTQKRLVKHRDAAKSNQSIGSEQKIYFSSDVLQRLETKCSKRDPQSGSCLIYQITLFFDIKLNLAVGDHKFGNLTAICAAFKLGFTKMVRHKNSSGLSKFSFLPQGHKYL